MWLQSVWELQNEAKQLLCHTVHHSSKLCSPGVRTLFGKVFLFQNYPIPTRSLQTSLGCLHECKYRLQTSMLNQLMWDHVRPLSELCLCSQLKNLLNSNSQLIPGNPTSVCLGPWSSIYFLVTLGFLQKCSLSLKTTQPTGANKDVPLPAVSLIYFQTDPCPNVLIVQHN